ncbi:hypothetical protein DY000_02030632 [Brassica cretica]|uniref:Uncharacterized protein n=1 Tax=Brassica cretica TaxID=69181 RepID=A0ABQ7DQP5_BRACR|nr:hypothetical protein DY000_02030632 [Brassica cretica]
MKEKPSYHPKRESRALQTRFGRIEERSIKYEYFEAKFWGYVLHSYFYVYQKADRHLEFLSTNYGCFFGTDIYRSDRRTVNFISVLPLIQKEPGNGRDIIGKILMPDFQIIYPIVKSTYVCVYDQLGDEATLVKQMVSDRTLPEYHIDLISESSGVALLEPSRSIRRFLRGSETSGLAMLLVRACGAETFVPWTLLERAGVQRQTVLATLRIIYPYEEMRGHPIPHGVTPLLLTPLSSPFRDVSVRTADIETLGAIYIDCGVPVMLGGPIGSETRQRWSCVLRYHSWCGLVIMTSSTVGFTEGKTLPEYHIDIISESSGVALLEPSRSIRRFLRFLQNPWQRGSETSGLAMLLVRACGAETFVPWTLLERAGVQRQTVLAMLRILFVHVRAKLS